jgi:hypothetical protein
MRPHISIFTETRGRRILFVGDMDPARGGWDASGNNWLGDAANLDSKHGSIQLGWVDEDEEDECGKSGKSSRSMGFFSKLF